MTNSGALVDHGGDIGQRYELRITDAQGEHLLGYTDIKGFADVIAKGFAKREACLKLRIIDRQAGITEWVK